MTLAAGDHLPETVFLEFGPNGVAPLDGASLFRGRKVVVFGLPGAYTRTCSALHLPSFMRTADALRAKGVEDIYCVAVNDPYVLFAWGDSTGASAKGIRFLADARSEFTAAIGMAYDNPAVGFVQRSKRYAMLVEDGVVTVLNVEPGTGVCEVSAGETLLAAI